jgi:EAL domain-containing protein (putative c-di-GMP-specific phosphodiesterase class I)
MTPVACAAVDKRIPRIAEILDAGGVETAFQPILSAPQRSIVGLEALSRGSLPGEAIIPPRTLFSMAEEAGVSEQLESLCRHRSVHRFSRLAGRSRDLMLFLNLHISADQTPETIATELDGLMASAALRPTGVALEILEAEIEDVGQLRELVRLCRDRGFLIVLDDVGSGYSNLDRIPLIKPDLLKIDRALIAHIDSDYHKRGAVKSLVDLGQKIGALVVAEGVETEDEAMVSLELGADLLQGYLLGRPCPVGSMHRPPLTTAQERVEQLAKRFRRHMAGKIQERKLQHERFAVVMAQILSHLQGVGPGSFDDVLASIVPGHTAVECAYVLDSSGVQISETICHPKAVRREHSSLFRPARRGTDHSLKEYCYVLLDVELRKYTTEPYVSLASGNVCRTISACFGDEPGENTYILCVDVLCD